MQVTLSELHVEKMTNLWEGGGEEEQGKGQEQKVRMQLGESMVPFKEHYDFELE